jgi:hypothetical protein
MTKVIAHLVDIESVTVKNPCGEINLPVLVEPKEITWLLLNGYSVFDYTKSLGMEPEIVEKSSITRFSKINTCRKEIANE